MHDASSLAALRFAQHSDACVLASYAVAAHAFTRLPIQDFFTDYCRHYGLQAPDSESCYASHFHNEWQVLKTSGYALIYSLHLTSQQASFLACQRAFFLNFIHAVSADRPALETELKSNQSNMLTVFLNDKGHSVTVGYDQQGFYKYDVNVGRVERGFSRLSDLGTLGSGFKLFKA